MVSGIVVFYKIATTCLLILVGYIVRRMKLLPENSVSVVSAYILYIGFPSYLMYYMPASVTLDTLHQYWFYPLIGAGLLLVTDLFGWLTGKIWARTGEGPTFRLLVALPNWVFMAMAVAEPLFREEGLRIVLLYNIGITFYVWTLGMTSFRGGETVGKVLRKAFLNPQTVALVLGFILALTAPFLVGLETIGSEELQALPIHIGIISPIWESIYLLGMTALPVSIFQIGLLLGAPRQSIDVGGEAPVRRGQMILLGVLRLLAAPALCMGVLLLGIWMGIPLTGNEFTVSIIIMAMPPAVACLAVVEVYGGRVRLTANAILWQTVAALGTAPLITQVAQAVYRMTNG